MSCFPPVFSRFLATLLLVSSSSVMAGTIVNESESNDTLGEANFGHTGVHYGAIGDGTSSPASLNDVDIWTFDLTAGVKFTADMMPGPAPEFTTSFSPTMVLLRETTFPFAPGELFGTVVAATGSVPAVSFTPWATERFYLVITAFSFIPADLFSGIALTDPSVFQLGPGLSGGIFQDSFLSESLQSWDYFLTLDGVTPVLGGSTGETVIPSPSTLFLLLIGGAVLSMRKLKSRC